MSTYGPGDLTTSAKTIPSVSIATLAGQNLLRLDLVIPPSGLWTADAQLDDTEAPTLGLTSSITIGNVSRVGTIVATGAPYGQPRCRVVAGSGGLSTTVVTPNEYGQVQLSRVASDIMTEAGEKVGNLDALSLTIVTSWQLVREGAWLALQRVLRQVPGLSLWVEHDGSLSVRQTTWTQTVALLHRAIVPQEKMLDLFADDGVVEPGVTVQTLFGSFDALRTQYILDPDDDRGGLRIRAWYV